MCISFDSARSRRWSATSGAWDFASGTEDTAPLLCIFPLARLEISSPERQGCFSSITSGCRLMLHARPRERSRLVVQPTADDDVGPRSRFAFCCSANCDRVFALANNLSRPSGLHTASSQHLKHSHIHKEYHTKYHTHTSLRASLPPTSASVLQISATPHTNRIP